MLTLMDILTILGIAVMVGFVVIVVFVSVYDLRYAKKARGETPPD